MRTAESNIFTICDSHRSKSTQDTSEPITNLVTKVSFPEIPEIFTLSPANYREHNTLADIRAAHNYDAITFGRPRSSSKVSDRDSDEEGTDPQINQCKKKSKFNKEDNNPLKRKRSEEVCLGNEFGIMDEIRVNSSMLPDEFLKQFRQDPANYLDASEETLKNLSQNALGGLHSPTARMNFLFQESPPSPITHLADRFTPAFGQRKGLNLNLTSLNEKNTKTLDFDSSEGPFLKQEISGSQDRKNFEDTYLPSPHFVNWSSNPPQFSRFSSDSAIGQPNQEQNSPISIRSGVKFSTYSRQFQAVIATFFTRSQRATQQTCRDSEDRPSAWIPHKSSRSRSSRAKPILKGRLLIEIPEVKEPSDLICLSQEKLFQTFRELTKSGDLGPTQKRCHEMALDKLKQRVSKTPLLHRGKISSTQINSAMKEKALQMQLQTKGDSGPAEDSLSEGKSMFSEISEMRIKSRLDAMTSGRQTINRSQSGIVRISKSRGSSSRQSARFSQHSAKEPSPSKHMDNDQNEQTDTTAESVNSSIPLSKLWTLSLIAFLLVLIEVLRLAEAL